MVFIYLFIYLFIYIDKIFKMIYYKKKYERYNRRVFVINLSYN